MNEQPISGRVGNKAFIWSKEAFGGRGAWYEIHKKGGLGRLANREEKKILGNPNIKEKVVEPEVPETVEEDIENDTIPNQEDDTTSDGMSRRRARALRNYGIKNNLIRNIVQGNGLGSVQKTVSETLQANVMGFKEKFDPISIARRLTGDLGAVILGKALGRSSEDIQYFTGYRSTARPLSGTSPTAKKLGGLDTASYTTVSENQQQRFRKGTGTANLLARLLNLMKKYHEETIKQHELDRNEEKARKEEREKWQKELVNTAGGKTATPVNGPNDNDGSGGSGGSGGVGQFLEQMAVDSVGALALRRLLKTKIGRKLIKTGLKAKGVLSKGISPIAKLFTGGASKIAGKVAEKGGTAAAKGTIKAAAGKIMKIADKSIIKKLVGKAIGKGAVKSVLKKIPGISIAAGLFFAADRAMSGDFKGAIGELSSGVAGTLPIAGTAAGLALDLGLIGRDIYKETYGVFPEDDDPKAVPGRLKEISEVVQEAVTAEDKPTATKVTQNTTPSNKTNTEGGTTPPASTGSTPAPTATPDSPPPPTSATGSPPAPSATPTSGATPATAGSPPPTTTPSAPNQSSAETNRLSRPPVVAPKATLSPPEPNPVAQRAQAAIETNEKEKTTTGSSMMKPIVVDNSKRINTKSKAEDTVSYDDSFSVREMDPTLHWITQTNLRRV